MTPETARALEPGITPGPWEASECTGFIAAAEGERAVLTADRGDWWCEEDHRLAAAAPDMRATISAQTWEYRVEEFNEPYWHPITKWSDEWPLHDGHTPFDNERVVRRPVGPVEVVE